MPQATRSAFFYEKIRYTAPMNMGKTHCHDHFEIYYLLSGERRYFIDNRIYDVRAGDMVLIPHGMLHKTTTIQAEHERILLAVPQEWIPLTLQNCFDSHCLHIPTQDRADIEWIFRQIGREYTRADPFSEQLLRQYVFQLFVCLKRLTEKNPLTMVSQPQDTMAERAARYICEHYQEPLKLETVAREFSVSREYFSHRFKQMTGFGFSEYVNQVRIAMAVQLLEAGDISITDVAFRCGFNDSNYFATVFKRIKGISPKKYQTGG